MKEKEIQLKYVPTGIIFKLPVEEALKIYKDARGIDYEILDKDYVPEEPKEEETTVYKQIVEDNTEEETEKEASELEALKKEADELGIKYNKNIGINKLQEKIEKYKAEK